MKKLSLSIALALATLGTTSIASAVTLEELAAKIDELSKENAELKRRLAQIEQLKESVDTHIAKLEKASKDNKMSMPANVVGLNHQYSYDMLDPTTRINSKQRLLLEQKRDGKLKANSVYLSGAVTAIADYQKSNTESKFGYLMRHPTESNQRTKEVSEAVIHSAQVGVTANLGDWVSGYIEMLYNPEQSFGSGTIVDIDRNQVEVRRGYVVIGNLNESPYYAS